MSPSVASAEGHAGLLDLRKPEHRALVGHLNEAANRGGALGMSLCKTRFALAVLRDTLQPDSPRTLSVEALDLILALLEELDRQCFYCMECPAVPRAG